MMHGQSLPPTATESHLMPVKSDSPLIAKTRIVLSASADVANAFAAYYAEHDCDVTTYDNGAKISLSVGHLTLQPGEKHLDIEVGSKSEAGVAQMKAALIAILQSIVPEADLDCRWKGAGESNGQGQPAGQPQQAHRQ